MKYLFLTLTFLIIGNGSFSQADFDFKTFHKSLVKINDDLYASNFEVTNQQYTGFLEFLHQNDQRQKLAAAQIDTVRWGDRLTYNEPYIRYYHSHKAYAKYPVVNIRYEGAVLYCEWLTEQYNSNEKRKFKKVLFRLPAKEEWTIAAKGGNPDALYPWDGNEMKNNKGRYLCNFKRGEGDHMGIAGKLNEDADVTAPVQSYWANKYGIYNLSGNVAEMIADKGRAVGGSWDDPAASVTTESEVTYDKPRPTIGFRVFMEIIEN